MVGARHVIEQIWNPPFLNQMASYDVVSTIYQSLPPGQPLPSAALLSAVAASRGGRGHRRGHGGGHGGGHGEGHGGGDGGGEGGGHGGGDGGGQYPPAQRSADSSLFPGSFDMAEMFTEDHGMSMDMLLGTSVVAWDNGAGSGVYGGVSGQGLTLVHFSAPPEPFLTQNTL